MRAELRDAIMEECLAASRAAMVIFDAVEARSITMEAAQALVALRVSAAGIGDGMAVLVLTGSGVR